jgi:UDP-2,3-diacylglucosamine pyrophosphatase LpxH
MTGGGERVRAAFVSDLHLGSRHCQARQLAGYLESLACAHLYLVGDVIDLWWLSKKRATWGPAQVRAMERIRAMARAGTRVTYIPGNHDRPLRALAGLAIPRVVLRRRAVHATVDGRRLLVIHGDEHDGATRLGGIREWLGEHLYDAILAGNSVLNDARERLGLRYWSMADFLKRRSSAAERYIDRFVAAAIADVRLRGLDGVVCGHTHRPRLMRVEGLIYANDGDWVESLSAIEELDDGTLRLVRWCGARIVEDVVPPRLVLAPPAMAGC